MRDEDRHLDAAVRAAEVHRARRLSEHEAEVMRVAEERRWKRRLLPLMPSEDDGWGGW